MADKLFRTYYNEKTELSAALDAGKILVQSGTDEPKKVDANLFASQLDLNSKENTSNKQNSLAVDGTGAKYPTVDAVNAANNIQNTELQLSQKFTSFGESYVNNFRSSMLDLGDEFFTSSAGYQIGKNKQLGLQPSLQMLPISGQAGKLRSIGSNRVNDFTVARNSTATYIDEDGLIKTALANVPRFDYSEGLDPILLLEKQFTNLLTYSEDFSDASWIKSGFGTGSVAIATSNFSISPDGSQTADRLIVDLNGGSSGGDQSLIQKNVNVSNGSYNRSIYIKTNDNSIKQILLACSAADINFTKITVNGNWQRFNITNNVTSSSTNIVVGLRNAGGVTGLSDSADLSIWGAQAEQSSVASSYIPTSGTTVTRLADVVGGAGDVNTFNDSEGVLFLQFNKMLSGRLGIISNGNDRVAVYFGGLSGTRIQLVYASNGVTRLHNIDPVSPQGLFKIAIKWDLFNVYYYVNGNLEATTSISSSTSGLNKINFYVDNLKIVGQIEDLRVYKTALTDAELTQLTTL
mgnify:CR=1 FL=1